MEDLGSIPGLGGSPGEGKGYPLQCSGLENSMDCRVHGVAKSRAGVSDFHLFVVCLPIRGSNVACYYVYSLVYLNILLF